MDSKLFLALFLIFGIVVAYTHAGRMSYRDLDDSADDDNDGDNGADSGDDDAALEGETTDQKRVRINSFDLLAEKRSIEKFLSEDDEANEFLDRSDRLFSSQRSQMKEAKKKFVPFALIFHPPIHSID